MTGVGLTAIEVARTRAVESRRPDRLFDDPYAERFVEASGMPALVPDGVPRTPDAYFAIRTRFFDERLADVAHLAARYGRPFPKPTDTDARAWLLDAVLAP